MSPDMNPIEHVWDYVSRAIFNRNNPPRSTQELIVAATEEWDNIPQEVINNLIIGTHRRVDALIRSRGGNTNSTLDDTAEGVRGPEQHAGEKAAGDGALRKGHHGRIALLWSAPGMEREVVAAAP
nr:unnamed protein product [Callosobruchus chinensis]